MAGAVAAWGFVWVLLGTAWARAPGDPEDDLPTDEALDDLPEAPDEDEPPEDEPPEPDEPFAVRDDVLWVPFGPATARGAVDLAIDPDDPDRLGMTTADGSAWLSVDGGVRWRVVLGPSDQLGEGSTDEAVRMAVEARADEIVEEAGGEVDADDEFFDEQSEDGLEELEALVEEVAGIEGELQADVERDPTYLSAIAADRPVARPRIWLGDEGVVWVGRPDGLWVSRDDGRTWRRVLGDPATAFARSAVGRWLAGTPTGVRFGLDRLSWADLVDGSDTSFIVDLVTGGGGTLAVASEGTLTSREGERWGDGAIGGTFLGGRVDPFDPDRAWLIAPDRLIAVELPEGEQVDRVYTPILDVADLAFGSEDELWIAGADGVWQSVDRGLSWERAWRGLYEQACGSVAITPSGPLAACEGGLYRLSVVDPEALAGTEDTRPTWVAIETLVGRSMSRDGVRPTPGLARARPVAAMLPTLRLYGYYRPEGDLRFSRTGSITDILDSTDVDDLQLEGGGTRRATGAEWRANVSVTWTPGRRSRSSADIDLMVIDGMPIVVGDEESGTAVAAINRTLSRTQQRSADTVIELYATRMRLVRQRAVLAFGPLLQRVHNELGIQEAEARLDVLTDGAVSAWNATD